MSIELNQISFCYASHTSYGEYALREVELFIGDGEFVGIMGHTGCGKTTLAQIVAGLLLPFAGTVKIDGYDINKKGYDRKLLRKKVGFVFQYPEHQLFETTVEREVAFGLKYSGLSWNERMERVKDALKCMGFSFERVRKESPMSFSGGEKRRIAIAGVLVSEPDILILDEPTAGLDAKSRSSLHKIIAKLNQRGATVLWISHDADSLCKYADRIIVLEKGKIVMDGPPREVFADQTKTEQYQIGTSQARVISEMLQKRGFKFERKPITYQELLDDLCNHFKKGG